MILDTPFILVCAHANRSKTVGKFLNAKTGYKNIFELAGGIRRISIIATPCLIFSCTSLVESVLKSAHASNDSKQQSIKISLFMIFPCNLIKSKDTPFILVCAHANRSKTVGKFLNAKTGYKNIFELAGGINYGWIDKGLSTTKEY
jgi:rhodanese-related sulfurtransferase